MTPPVTPSSASDSAGTRFLDALRRGELEAAVALLPADATLRVAGVDHTWTGPAQIAGFLERGVQARPGAAYQALTRHVGRGAVIDDARLAGLLAGNRPGESTEIPAQITIREKEGEIGSIHVAIPPIFLSALQGAAVDPLELSVAQMTISLRPINDPSLTTIQLAEAKPVSIPQPAAPAKVEEAPTRRRAPILIGLLVLLLLLGGGAFAYMSMNKDSSPPPVATPSPTITPKPKPTKKPTTKPTPPTPTHTEKPTVTLSANLAFGSDSAQLSSSAKTAIRQLAQQARKAKVTGVIEVDGYTDSVGSAAHGLTLSRNRADAVAAVLRSELQGLDITVISKGYGEANPVASNKTEAGRAQNRRVEIFLPDQ